MVYEPHPDFKEPGDDTIIWRYMDFSKFMALVHTRTLFFAPADKLSDPYEGSLPEASRDAYEAELLAQQRNIPVEVARTVLANNKALHQQMRQSAHINCWHMNQGESAAMWSQYLKNAEGIAVKSTVGGLKQALSLHTLNEIHIGTVSYIDYSKERWKDYYNPLRPFLYKRLSFEHEKEIRAVIMHMVEPENEKITEIRSVPFDANIPCDLDALIGEVYLAPKTLSWLHKLVESLLDHYGLDKKVVQSSMEDKAVI